MHILVIDGAHVEAEFREKFGPSHEYRFINTQHEEPSEWPLIEQAIAGAVPVAGVAFCFGQTDRHSHSYRLLEKSASPVFVENLKESLSEMRWEAMNGSPAMHFFGFCGLPTLLNRTLLEVSLYHEADRTKLAEICAALGTDYRVVEDRVGLVTPRVICQIINEACFTLQEGTASMQDIDLGMKLGTNYPRGPFAWANAIGVERVYAVLEALWHDTHDERYKVCPLLKRQALRGEPFAV
ncbi:3-hydroxyacyl-CoA dehydrogenase [Hymenobacter sp. BT683]|uniref:3-hydroxyacyl-CoA dehydrogenase n=2 Tax=Hymenobacter jeongseonensis TaxID=2791027 RepID=A0ABS0ICB0_9BACT|nr:3-hydroxyacyl-CoA dehydrogenase [Hymenobacter jeongseonensis]